MAIIYVKCGQYDNALDELDELLAQQTPFTVFDFMQNPELEPLRKLKRYQEIMRKYAVTAAQP
ncbi:MAG: hypothetical protein WAU88_00175 [Candidatus Zixiibacteriota bacterium]